MVLTDLDLAFDTIDHKILLKKLKYIGLSDDATNWIESYRKNRITFVEIEGYISSERHIKCGLYT